MTGHVDFDDHFDAAVETVFLDFGELLAGVGEAGAVGALLGEEGNGGDVEGPTLAVGGVEVEAVEFVPG